MQWVVRASLRRVLAGGCDAVGGERKFKEGFGGRMCTVGGESEFNEGFGGRM